MSPIARAVAFGAVAAILCTACGGDRVGPASQAVVVERVGDGDSFELVGGDRVRLLQIDAPELGQGECYADEAHALLRTLLPEGGAIELEADPQLDDTDRYERLLRYALVGGLNVGVELVRQGAAAPYFRGAEEGRFADDLLAALEEARSERRGMWDACSVDWTATRQVETSYR